MALVFKRVLAFAILMAAYVVHPLLGLVGLLAGFGYVVMRRQRGVVSGPELNS